MDKLDRQILNELQIDSGRPLSEIAEQLALSLSSCHRRTRRLEERGVIEGYAARLNAKRLGLELEVFVEIRLASQSREALQSFEKAVMDERRAYSSADACSSTGRCQHAVNLHT